MLVDLERLEATAASHRFFSHNRFNLISFHDRDHGPGDGKPAKDWVRQFLSANGFALPNLRLQVLCFPRLLGYVFNPLSIWLCWSDNVLKAVVYEVHNTFGGRHAYVLPVSDLPDAKSGSHQQCDKAFYVSPFIEPEARYSFRLRLNADRIAVTIDELGAEGTRMLATLSGRFVAVSDRNILSCLLRYPLMTAKVIAGIHWEAFRVWLKGARFRGIKGPRRARAKMRSGNLV